MHRFRLSNVCLLVLATLLAACTQPTAPPATQAPAAQAPPGSTPAAPAATASKPKPQADAGVLRVTLADLGGENMDVIIPQTNNVTPLIYEPLLRYDSEGKLIPWLAERFSMSSDGKVWTFNLRQSVKWTNGDELTAEDVKFSIERFVSEESRSPWSPLHRQTVDRVEAADKYTVRVHAKDPPYVFYPDAISGTAIHQKSYFERVGLDGFQKQPMGTGPWRLVRFTPSQSAELEPNPDYWGTKPVWDRLVLLHAPEESTRMAMLRRGEADVVGVSFDNAVSLRSEGYALRQTDASTIPGLFLPGFYLKAGGATSDVRVREAMDLAMNRQEIVDSFFRGFGKPAAGNISLTELHWGFDPIWYSIKYDPARAKQLLQEAGYPGRFSDPVVRIFSVVQASAGWEPDLLQVISGYWEAVGIQTQLVPMDFTAFRSAWIAKDPNIMGGVAPWMGIASGSAQNSIPAQQNHMTSRGVNVSGNDPELDKLFFEMVAELDAEQRLAKWKTVQQKAFAQHSVLGIARIYDQYAVSDKVGEWTGLDHLNNGFLLGLTGIQRK